MRFLARSFAKGLLFVVPLVATGYLIYWLVTWLDGILGLPIPGVGLALTLASITVIGVFASNVAGRKFFSGFEKLIDRLPVVKLLYSSIKDLMGAFVGDKRSFDQPVYVDVSPDGDVRVLGFMTCQRFDDAGLAGYVAVYLPQSYNFAGNLIVVKRDRVHPMDADGSQFLAFVMSGGVAQMSAASTVMDGAHPLLVRKST